MSGWWCFCTEDVWSTHDPRSAAGLLLTGGPRLDLAMLLFNLSPWHQTCLPNGCLVATHNTCPRGVPRSAPAPSGRNAIALTHQESWSDAIFGQPSSLPLSAGWQGGGKKRGACLAEHALLLSASLPTFPGPGRILSEANAAVRFGSSERTEPWGLVQGTRRTNAVHRGGPGGGRHPKIPACANGIVREIE